VPFLHDSSYTRRKGKDETGDAGLVFTLVLFLDDVWAQRKRVF
jgi:hypothetical protein